MRPALFWVIKQRVVVISYRHLGTTYWSHEDGTGCPEMVINYHYLLVMTQKSAVLLQNMCVTWTAFIQHNLQTCYGTQWTH